MTQAVPVARAFRKPGEDWDQGDVADAVYFGALDADRPGVLVTPACDIEQDKVDLWTFVVLYRDEDVARGLLAKDLENFRRTSASLSKGQRDGLGKKIRELIEHRFGRYHWLPIAIGGCAAHVADFSCVTSLPVAEVRAKARRIASLTSSWREQVPARYVAYMGRVGTIDFRREELDEHVARLLNAVIGP